MIRDAIECPDRVGPYRVLGLLGSGASGDVYRAEDGDGEVAVKVLARQLVGSARARSTFAREWDLTTPLRHDGIARPIDRLEVGGRICVVFELVRGVPLDRWLNEARSEAQIARVLADVADALAYAHSRGVVHRDIKPSNIIIRDDGRPVVVDFGIAKAIGTRATSTFAGAGSIGYMAPEQAAGARAHATADIYSIGMILRSSVAEPSRDLRRIIDAATATEPSDRYQDAGRLTADLRALLTGAPVLAPRVGLHTKARRAAWRHPWLTTCAVLLAIGAFAVGISLRARPPVTASLVIPVGITVSERRFNPETSGYLVPERIEGASLEPGWVRLVVKDGERSVELTRLSQAGDRIELPSTLPDETTIGMVLVGDLWIDAHEVTNAEYRAFVEATGHAPPSWWAVVYEPEWDDLPVVGVSWDDAVSYAEWLGKRLPSLAEWRAVASPDGRLTPWNGPADREEIASRSNAGGTGWLAMRTPDGREERIRRAMSRLRTASQAGDDRTDGVVHLLGNVSEWTDSPFVDPPSGALKPDQRSIAGMAFEDPGGLDPQLGHVQSAHPESIALGRGFRCARSAR